VGEITCEKIAKRIYIYIVRTYWMPQIFTLTEYEYAMQGEIKLHCLCMRLWGREDDMDRKETEDN